MVLREDVLRNMTQRSRKSSSSFRKDHVVCARLCSPYRVATSLLQQCAERYRIAVVRFEKQPRSFQLLAGKSRVIRDTRLTGCTLISVLSGAKCHGIYNRVRDVRCHDTKPRTCRCEYYIARNTRFLLSVNVSYTPF